MKAKIQTETDDSANGGKSSLSHPRHPSPYRAGGSRLKRLAEFQRLAAVWAVALTLGMCALARGQEETERVDRTLAFPSGGTLQLHNFSGDVHITGTTGRVLVIKAVRRAKRDLLDHITLDVRTSGSTVTIDANKRAPHWRHHGDNVVETSFEIQAPASAKLDVEVFSSKLKVQGMAGPERLKTFSGDVTVDAVAAGAAPQLTVETFSGGIHVRLVNSAKGKADFKSFSGRLNAKPPLRLHSTGHEWVFGSAPGAVGDGMLDFRTFSGGVQLAE